MGRWAGLAPPEKREPPDPPGRRGPGEAQVGLEQQGPLALQEQMSGRQGPREPRGLPVHQDRLDRPARRDRKERSHPQGRERIQGARGPQERQEAWDPPGPRALPEWWGRRGAEVTREQLGPPELLGPEERTERWETREMPGQLEPRARRARRETRQQRARRAPRARRDLGATRGRLVQQETRATREDPVAARKMALREARQRQDRRQQWALEVPRDLRARQEGWVPPDRAVRQGQGVVQAARVPLDRQGTGVISDRRETQAPRQQRETRDPLAKQAVPVQLPTLAPRQAQATLVKREGPGPPATPEGRHPLDPSAQRPRRRRPVEQVASREQVQQGVSVRLERPWSRLRKSSTPPPRTAPMRPWSRSR